MRLALWGAVLVGLLPAFGVAGLEGLVTHVRDGDTIELESRTVRLQGIDAPESDQPHGAVASRALEAKIGGRRVRIETHGRGNYGRIIGTVHLRNTNINAWLVRAGHAWVYEKYNDDPRLPRLERRAREADRGLWAASDPVPPWQWRHGASRGSSSGERDRDCSDFDTQAVAQKFFEANQPGDPHSLDGDGDGAACEGLP